MYGLVSDVEMGYLGSAAGPRGLIGSDEMFNILERDYALSNNFAYSNTEKDWIIKAKIYGILIRKDNRRNETLYTTTRLAYNYQLITNCWRGFERFVKRDHFVMVQLQCLNGRNVDIYILMHRTF